MDPMKRYLRPTPTFDCDNESIKGKAKDLSAGQEKVADKAKSLFYFVRDEIKYNPLPVHLLEDYQASKTLTTGRGFCVEKASLLVALARAAGIPARLHLADIRNHLVPNRLKQLIGTDLFSYHGYSGLYVEGKWVKATPAFDLKMCQENRIIPVEFDGKHDAMFHSHNLDGKLHIEYVKDHGHFDDLPFDTITNLRIQALGADIFQRLRQAIEARKARG